VPPVTLFPANNLAIGRGDKRRQLSVKWLDRLTSLHDDTFTFPFVVDEKRLACSSIENGQEPRPVCTEKVPNFPSSEAP
jgi:hypothetical protein